MSIEKMSAQDAHKTLLCKRKKPTRRAQDFTLEKVLWSTLWEKGCLDQCQVLWPQGFPTRLSTRRCHKTWQQGLQYGKYCTYGTYFPLLCIFQSPSFPSATPAGAFSRKKNTLLGDHVIQKLTFGRKGHPKIDFWARRSPKN